MQGVDLKQMEELDRRLDELLKRVPEKRKALHQRLGKIVKKLVDQQIAGSINDGGGRIQGMQEVHIGSGGGYAKVRAKGGISGANSPGAVTNYLENGHRIPRPTGKNKRYRVRIKNAYVNGRHFYQKASSIAETEVISAAEQFADEITGLFNG